MSYLTADELREKVMDKFSSLEQEIGKKRLKLLLMKFIEGENKYKFNDELLEERKELNKEHSQEIQGRDYYKLNKFYKSLKTFEDRPAFVLYCLECLLANREEE